MKTDFAKLCLIGNIVFPTKKPKLMNSFGGIIFNEVCFC